MRKLVVSEFITLDGVFEDPGGAEGFEHGGWSFDYSGDDQMKFKYDELMDADAQLLGRKTYEGFAKAWPSMAGQNDFADKMNDMPKYVVSGTLAKLDWKNSHLIKGDLKEAVTGLKQQPGKDILVAGSGQLVRSLLQLGLIDELRLMVHPVILDAGKRLFDGAHKTGLKLLDTKPFNSGAVVLTYQPLAK